MAKQTAKATKEFKPKISKSETEAKLAGKKIRGFVWGENGLVGLVLADHTKIKFNGFLFD